MAKAAFPKGNTFMKMRDKLGAIFEDEDFADLFPRRGQPELRAALDHCREGDELVVWKLDRFGRSLKEPINGVRGAE